MTDTLMVGVSGVRGIVDKDLTPDIVARWARAFGRWAGERKPLVVVGRDSRPSGPRFARAVHEGLIAAGCDVIDVGLVPTPTIQLAVTFHHAGGGIAVTASHNPSEWNALKFIGGDGIFLDGADGVRVRDWAASGSEDGAPRTGDAPGVTADTGAIERHLESVLTLPAVDVDAIRKCHFRVALDTVRGAGGVIMPALLERLGCDVWGLELTPDGLFPRAPEPVPEHLGALGTAVRKSAAALGIAVDPDVDRLALVDETGRPIGEDYTLAFAVRAVLCDPAAGGPAPQSPLIFYPPNRRAVVCNLSTSLVVEDAARACGGTIVRTPVGETHVAHRMVDLGAVIGGEGNGGVIYPTLHAGRDAPIAAALALTLLARSGRRVSELVAAAPRYTIVKAKTPRGPALDKVYAALRKRFSDATVDTQDGLRLAWPDRWLHVRPSNTEPIVRLIAEAPADGEAQKLVDEGKRLCGAA
jgi:phosphomannomutase